MRNRPSTLTGHELINTVVQVGAQGDNNHNKRVMSLQFYRFSCFCPCPSLLLPLFLPHVCGRWGVSTDCKCVPLFVWKCCFSYRARATISAILGFYCTTLVMWPTPKETSSYCITTVMSSGGLCFLLWVSLYQMRWNKGMIYTVKSRYIFD